MKSGAAAVALALNFLGGQDALAEPRPETFLSGGVPITAEWFRASTAEHLLAEHPRSTLTVIIGPSVFGFRSLA